MGLLRAEGFSERANVIVNEMGKIIFVKVYPIRELPDIGEILSVLKSYKGNG
jgi:peroxiredoxin